MATHSSVLAWRIPGSGEPGGLPSMGLHRVGHDWSDLAAAAAAHTVISHRYRWYRFMHRYFGGIFCVSFSLLTVVLYAGNAWGIHLGLYCTWWAHPYRYLLDLSQPCGWTSPSSSYYSCKTYLRSNHQGTLKKHGLLFTGQGGMANGCRSQVERKCRHVAMSLLELRVGYLGLKVHSLQ